MNLNNQKTKKFHKGHIQVQKVCPNKQNDFFHDRLFLQKWTEILDLKVLS